MPHKPVCPYIRGCQLEHFYFTHKALDSDILKCFTGHDLALMALCKLFVGAKSITCTCANWGENLLSLKATLRWWRAAMKNRGHDVECDLHHMEYSQVYSLDDFLDKNPPTKPLAISVGTRHGEVEERASGFNSP
ncbi:uncharacterized protein BKA55DRAFT_697567 [Fusarium redolens]|uniref:Uncharacterized protein n=1 Tax=Fusarium redolens TaxID=48865 RepID=A0A9P9JTY4_FUSRE|nr:uncharacterized protein BKA55DRAFT_697567 [Fusarium redolens]KAH7220514.1 hypothetical protein BKA55DRAFT_697567 [Fusarium redolens]